ncbi:SDR family NAD(P)-dependent oxidoreductase [Ferrimicrobium acidiphilum]|uniref:SDR family NAD(P)-dependent oxidoreductase n=1 Tax=Ferrimicrobium acidiphilum TaxID=121039 RepID=UPI0023F30F9C|nr:SDR family NAD(P)-dependent oxidoreductase [Ferrimicrobium acidiphilum]
MTTSVGRRPLEHVLVLGGGSEIARALLMRLAGVSLRSVILMGPHAETLKRTREQLLAAFPKLTVVTLALDLSELQTVDMAVAKALKRLEVIDCVIMAAGWLGAQEMDERDPESVAHTLTVNFTGPAMALTRCAERLEEQGYGLMIVLSSVAGERVRRSNYLYGAAKAGLDGFALGLADRVHPKVSVMVIRPGFVSTAMTRSLATPPLATTAERVASDIIRGISSGATIVWSPRSMRAIMAIYRHLPRAIARQIRY